MTAIVFPAMGAAQSSNVHVVASGLNGPRGLKFGPDGMLYVAEAGTGGTTTTSATDCAQVLSPVGPYANGNTGRISKIDRSGKRTTVASGFPSAESSLPTHDTDGVADVAFLDGQLYAVTAGGGCSHGNLSTPNAIYRVNTRSGSYSIVCGAERVLAETPRSLLEPAGF